jgi:hypothetical protein
MRAFVAICAIVIAGILPGSTRNVASALQPVVTPEVADGPPQILVKGGRLLLGSNDIVVEFRSSPNRHVRAVTVVAAQASAVSRPPISLSRDGRRRFHGTIVLTSTGSCPVRIGWWEGGGHRSQTFTLPVVAEYH